MSVVLVDFGAGMAQLRSVAIFKTALCVSYPNKNRGAVSFGYTKRVIMSIIY